MAILQGIIEFLKSDAAGYAAWGLFLLSEAIGALPNVKASGVFQAIQNGIKFMLDKVKKPQLPGV